jgi:hypothetical protein
MIQDRLGALLREAVPPLGLPLQGELVVRAARRRRARRQASTALAALTVAAAVSPFVLSGSSHPALPAVVPEPPSVHRPVLPAHLVNAKGVRVLAADTLVQMSDDGRFDHAVRNPLLDPPVLRLYRSGLVLGPDQTTGSYRQSHLTRVQLSQAKALIVQGGLDQGGLDYGMPTNTGFTGGQEEFQVPGAPNTQLEFGGEVNGVPSSEAGLSGEQRAARAALAELVGLLQRAVTGGTTYAPVEWTRFARSFTLHPPAIMQPYPAWTGSTPLDQGGLVAAYTHCTGVPAKDESPAAGQSDYRWAGRNWELLYQPVLPGETACHARTT